MLSACAQSANKPWIVGGKICVQLSTHGRRLNTFGMQRCEQMAVLPHFMRCFVTGFSTAKSAVFTLLSTLFSPLSTGPITNITI